MPTSLDLKSIIPRKLSEEVELNFAGLFHTSTSVHEIQIGDWWSRSPFAF